MFMHILCITLHNKRMEKTFIIIFISISISRSSCFKLTNNPTFHANGSYFNFHVNWPKADSQCFYRVLNFLFRFCYTVFYYITVCPAINMLPILSNFDNLLITILTDQVFLLTSQLNDSTNNTVLDRKSTRLNS